MTNPAKTITGQTPAGETVTATLGEPFASSDGPEWRVAIHCPVLFPSDKAVAGVDTAQALELAETLVMSLFERHGIKATHLAGGHTPAKRR